MAELKRKREKKKKKGARKKRTRKKGRIKGLSVAVLSLGMRPRLEYLEKY
jgi:hypothetical protein